VSQSKKTTREFIIQARAIHGSKYKYTKTVYSGWNCKVIISCPKHGNFKQTAYVHLKGHGCQKCGFEFISSKKTLDTETFKKRAYDKHGRKFGYSKFIYTRYNKKGIVTCKKHGDFKISPSSHLLGLGGCPKCFVTQAIARAKKNLTEYIY